MIFLSLEKEIHEEPLKMFNPFCQRFFILELNPICNQSEILLEDHSKDTVTKRSILKAKGFQQFSYT
jgi:hypothetical protein